MKISIANKTADRIDLENILRSKNPGEEIDVTGMGLITKRKCGGALTSGHSMFLSAAKKIERAAPDGGTWLFAHVVAASGLAIALLLAWHGRGFWCGVAFALAITARPPVLLAVPLLATVIAGRSAGQVRRRGRRTGAFGTPALAAIPVLALGVVTLVLKQLRSSSPLDFGYAAMITPPQLARRLAEHGQFSLAYLGDNLRYLLYQPPRLLPSFPFAVSDPRGVGVLFVTPAFVAMLAAIGGASGRGRRLVLAAWLSLIAVTVPALLYFNTGWVQWGGRFLLDGWPVWLLLAGMGLQRLGRRLAVALGVLSVVSNVWAVVATLSSGEGRRRGRRPDPGCRGVRADRRRSLANGGRPEGARQAADGRARAARDPPPEAQDLSTRPASRPAQPELRLSRAVRSLPRPGARP